MINVVVANVKESLLRCIVVICPAYSTFVGRAGMNSIMDHMPQDGLPHISLSSGSRIMFRYVSKINEFLYFYEHKSVELRKFLQDVENHWCHI